MRTRRSGHANPSMAVFALTQVSLGVWGLVLAVTKAEFAPVWDPVPKWMPAHAALAYLSASVSLVCGIGLLWQRTALWAARALFATLLLWLLVFRLPGVFPSPSIGTFFASSEISVMVAAAWVLCLSIAHQLGSGRAGQRLPTVTGNTSLRLARVLYGLALVHFGLAHFVYLESTVVLIPAWLPWHSGWAYFTGSTFIAAGLALLTGVFARLAATLSAIQLGLFTLLVWVPILAAGSKDPFQWSETILSWTLTTAAWVVADSFLGTRWLALKNR